ncbi:MAG TPA: RNA-binding protein [Patescibacteria group bacterium]|nr:RNA-binding protein [Patescibacteria group bacterium]
MDEKEQKNKLFVSNLAYSVDDNALLEMFSGIEGVTVVEAKVITDKFNNNRSKGFGFVTCETDEMAEIAIKEINGKEIDGRQIFVNVARPQVKRDNFDRGGNSGYRSNSYR